jgi:Xaa-Pro aminopeptidase
VSPELLSKLDRAVKSAQFPKARRLQVRVDQPGPFDLPITPLGMLKPSAGGHSIPLLYDELFLGRDPDSDVVLPYLAVAKTHCVLRFQEGYWLVRDLNNNGVSINGETIHEGWLLPGATLGIATHRFELDYATSSNSAPPEMPVPINEFSVSDEDLSVDRDVVSQDSESDDVEVDESALIDSDDGGHVDNASHFDIDVELNACNAALASSGVQPCVTKSTENNPSPPGSAADEPLRAVDDMLAAIEELQPPIDESHAHDKKAPSPREKRIRSRSKTKPIADKSRQPESSPPTSLVVTKQQVSVVQQKHERIVQFLKDREFDGLLLSRPASIAWYTGGADVPRDLSGQAAAALLITPEGGTLFARSADRGLLLNHATSDVVLQHRECAWPTEACGLFADRGGTKKLACDQPIDSCADVSSEVSALRLPLRPQEIENLRKLGIRVARTVERAAREFHRGDTEAQIAGDVASRLIRHEVVPVQIQVWGDGRGQSVQNWRYGRETVDHDCTISVIARRHGLHVAVSRTVSFGIPSKELRWTFPDMLMAHATALSGSRDQADVGKVWAEVQQACETLGESEDWLATDPGCVTGYELSEAPISPRSPLKLAAGMPVVWRSLIGAARAVDTVLVRETGSKVVTQTGEWPQLGIVVNNEQFFVQNVLQRTH